jgi:hypothetical protein
MLSRKITRSIAAGGAAIAVAIGAYAISDSSSTKPAAATAQVAPPAQSTQAPAGQAPQNWTPGSGTIITGAEADKATAVAVAAYPDGTVNRVLQLSDGSYAVHRINVGSPHHIFVSKDFTVTGTA